RLLPANSRADRAGGGVGLGMFYVQGEPLRGLWGARGESGGGPGRGCGARLAHSFRSLHRHPSTATSAPERRRLCHGGRSVGRQTGVWYWVRQYPLGLSGLRHPERGGAREDGRSARYHSQGLAQGAFSARGTILELLGNNVVPKASGAATP